MYEDKLILIYDFDGTLTPYGMPQYEVIKRCGYDDAKMMERIKKVMKEKNLNLYEAYCESIYEILVENGISVSEDSICIGFEDVEFNNGVLDYFKNLYSKNVLQFVVTSGFDNYIKRTKISGFLDGVYGTMTNFQNSKLKVTRLMSDEDKIDAIKDIVLKNNSKLTNVIYFGDGLTDEYAFRYVHENGGKSIYLYDDENSETLKKLEALGIIDFTFSKDYSIESDIWKYVSSRLKEKQM